MTTLSINFVKRARISSWSGWGLCFAGVCAACVVALNYAEAQAELEQAQTRLARVQRTTATPRTAATVTAVPRDDEKIVASVNNQLNRPWNGLFAELDRVASPKVALLTVESQGQTRALRMSGEAQSMSDVAAYVNQLGQSPLLESAYLSQHENKPSGPVSLIRFSVDAVWRATP